MTEKLRKTVLEHVNNPNYQPVKPAVIAKQLGLAGEAVHELKKTIKQMVKAGEVDWGPSHLVFSNLKTHLANTDEPLHRWPATSVGHEKDRRKQKLKPKPSGDSKHFTGTFRRAAGGFGFVRPEGTLRTEGRDADVFIPADKTGDAASGDVVSVRLESKRGRMGKHEGVIIDVVERATNRFVGVYFEQAGMGMVQIDGKLFGNPIYVGDPGAKGVQPDDKVVIEMVRFPSHTRDGEGVIVEVLGPRGQPGVDTMSIIYEFNLPGEFAEDVLAESRKQAEQFDESIGRGRRDLTNLPIVTIDPVDARDFDDAISLERTDNGHWLLGRPHRRRLPLRRAENAARPRSPRPRDERLPARPRHPDAAGDHLQQPGQPAAEQSPLRPLGHDGVHRRRRPRRDRCLQIRHQEPPPIHVRRGRRIPGGQRN